MEHHLAHLASCFFVSPFHDATAVSVDGFGDFSSAAWGVGLGTELSVEGRVYFPHSLGVFYQAMTQYLASRTMATSTRSWARALWETRFLPQMRHIVRLLDDGRSLSN